MCHSRRRAKKNPIGILWIEEYPTHFHESWFHSEIRSIQFSFIFLFIHQSVFLPKAHSRFFSCFDASTYFHPSDTRLPVAFHTYAIYYGHGFTRTNRLSAHPKSSKKNKTKIVPKRDAWLSCALLWSRRAFAILLYLQFVMYHFDVTATVACTTEIE